MIIPMAVEITIIDLFGQNVSIELSHSNKQRKHRDIKLPLTNVS